MFEHVHHVYGLGPGNTAVQNRFSREIFLESLPVLYRGAADKEDDAVVRRTGGILLLESRELLIPLQLLVQFGYTFHPVDFSRPAPEKDSAEPDDRAVIFVRMRVHVLRVPEDGPLVRVFAGNADSYLMKAVWHLYHIVLAAVASVAPAVEAVQGIFAFAVVGAIPCESLRRTFLQLHKFSVNDYLELPCFRSADVEKAEHVALEGEAEPGFLASGSEHRVEPTREFLQFRPVGSAHRLPVPVIAGDILRHIHGGVVPSRAIKRL